MLLVGVRSYLSGYFDTKENEIDKLLNAEDGISFLLIWSIFEERCFNGFFTIKSIKDKNDSFQDKELYKQFSLVVEELHKRYKDDTNWKNLKGKQQISGKVKHIEYSDMDNLRKKDFATFSDIEVIRFGLFVIFRYRNNIFHGSKGVESWLKFGDQIKDCIKMMILYLKEKKVTTNTVPTPASPIQAMP